MLFGDCIIFRKYWLDEFYGSVQPSELGKLSLCPFPIFLVRCHLGPFLHNFSQKFCKFFHSWCKSENYFLFQVYACRRPWSVWYCVNPVHRNSKCILYIFFVFFHFGVKTSLLVFLCFVVGHETLYVFQFIAKFSTVCLCFFRVDIIFSWNIFVRRISFAIFTLFYFNIFSE